MSKQDNQPAFPATEEHGCNSGWSGMSLRQYAAIKLKVPDSGIDWLDEMIIKSKRDEIAAKAMQSTLADDAYVERTETASEWLAIVAKASYEMADAMLKAGKA